MRWAGALALGLLAAPAAIAGDLTITRWDSDPHHAVLGPLRASFALHARAGSRWLLGGAWTGPVTKRSIERFEEQFLDATFASLHYTYIKEGKPMTRIYHAMSGSTIPWPVQGMSPRRGFDVFVLPRVGEAWAHAGAHEATSIEASPLSDDMPIDIYTASAEYKAVRSVERDIEAGIVPGAGEAVLFSSRTPCRVCESALRYFARRYTVSLRVNHISDAGAAIAQRFVRERRAFLATLRAALPPLDTAGGADLSSASMLLRCPIAASREHSP